MAMRKSVSGVFKYMLLSALILGAVFLCSCGAKEEETLLEPEGSLELEYATQFSVDYYDNGCSLITIGGEDKFFLVPEGMEDDISIAPPGASIIQAPLSNIYVATSSAMDHFVKLNALDRVLFTSTKEDNWGIGEVRDAIRNEEMFYIGKYSAPDFEALVSEGCSFALENTMIWHSPDIKEKLETLGIPVMVERSSYEEHPLGRVEWIKLYGVLTGREAEAKSYFHEQVALLQSLEEVPTDEKTVAFFYISSNGAAVVRRSGDYVSRMISLAGGRYIPTEDGEGEEGTSTFNMQMEAFYAAAKDADYLIYNSTIDGELQTIDDLISKSELLKDFKAVKEGKVWCTEQDMFQKSTAAAGMIKDLNKIIAGSNEKALTFFHRLG